MNTLKIPLRTYRRYTASIHKQNQEIWYSLVRDELCTELLKLRSSLEDTYKIAKELCEKPDLGTGDTLEALQAKDSARLSVVQLLVEGTSYLAKVQGQQQPKYHKMGQQNIMMQPHP